jgi:hypothetical protein
MLRTQQLTLWLKQIFDQHPVVLIPLAGDAGFRRYFRFTLPPAENNNFMPCHYIAVDAPNEYSNNEQFIKVQQYLAAQKIHVPEIIAAELSQGFLCLSDLGQQTLADVITPQNMAFYYQQALAIALAIAAIKPKAQNDFPLYDAAFVQRELDIFNDWLLVEHLSIKLSAQEKSQLQQCYNLLISNALEQPQVVMHRDFHSRNLMLTNVHDEQHLAVIDFQDAVIGPITYDAVSLLKDCYLKWPREQIMPLFTQFCNQLTQQQQLAEFDQTQWQRWFDLTGLQRHIKAAGIFARLHHRDNKSHYLEDLPLTLQYIVETSQQYKEFSFVEKLVNERVLPNLKNINKSAP